MAYRVQLEIFEGPMDLLLHLIESQEIDVWDIPIARITRQYLDHLAQLDELNLDIAGEFLVMAATLMAIKAKMLLPTAPLEDPESTGDPRAELVQRLLEYKRFREKAEELSSLAVEGSSHFPLGHSEIPEAVLPKFTNPIGALGIKDLARAFQTVLAGRRTIPPNPIVHRTVTVEQRVSHLVRFFSQVSRTTFESLFVADSSRQELIATFLAVLELVRRGFLGAHQERPFSSIVLYRAGGDAA